MWFKLGHRIRFKDKCDIDHVTCTQGQIVAHSVTTWVLSCAQSYTIKNKGGTKGSSQWCHETSKIFWTQIKNFNFPVYEHVSYAVT